MNAKMPMRTVAYNQMLEWINRESLSVNSYLPSERELADKFYTSRITIRQALDRFDDQAKLTGAELAVEMLKLRADVPVILCTGFSDAVPPERALALGIREYLVKPITQRALAEAVHRLLESVE